MLRDEGEAFEAKLREAGVDVEHRRFESSIHGFSALDEGDTKTREAINTVAAGCAGSLQSPLRLQRATS